MLGKGTVPNVVESSKLFVSKQISHETDYEENTGDNPYNHI